MLLADPHEIHVGRLQTLVQVLVRPHVGLLLDLMMVVGVMKVYTVRLRQRGMCGAFLLLLACSSLAVLLTLLEPLCVCVNRVRTCSWWVGSYV